MSRMRGMQQKTLFAYSKDAEIRREIVIEHVVSDAKGDKALLALLRAEEHAERVIEDVVPVTPATRARPKGEAAIFEGREAGDALRQAIESRVRGTGAHEDEVEDIAEVVLEHLRATVLAEREGGRKGGISSGIVRSRGIAIQEEASPCQDVPHQEQPEYVDADEANADQEGPTAEDLADADRLATQVLADCVGDAWLRTITQSPACTYDDGWGR